MRHTPARAISHALITAALLTACTSTPPSTDPTDYALTDEQPALETVTAENPVSTNAQQQPGYLLVRTIYDSNRDAKVQLNEPPIPGWGLRITPLNANNQASGPARIERTPTGSRRYIGTFLNLPYGSYKIEELIPVSTNGANDGWIGTRGNERTVTLSKNVPFRNVDFTNACLENNQVIAFPKTNFSAWRCAPKFDLLPRITSFTANPTVVTTGGSSTLSWVVPDLASLEVDQGVGVVTASSKSVVVNAKTTFMLSAKNAFGVRRVSVTVDVSTGGGSDGVWEVVANGSLAGDDLLALTTQAKFNAIIPEALKDGRVLLTVSAALTEPLNGARYILNPADKSIRRISDAVKLLNLFNELSPGTSRAIAGNTVLSTGPSQSGANGEVGLYLENIDSGSRTFKRNVKFSDLTEAIATRSGEFLFLDSALAYNLNNNLIRSLPASVNQVLVRSGIVYLEEAKKLISREEVRNEQFNQIGEKIRVIDLATGISSLSPTLRDNCGPMYYSAVFGNVNDSKVLVTGGLDLNPRIQYPDACIYDPQTNTFTKIAPANAPLTNARTTNLPDGRVFFARSQPQVFNPQNSSFRTLTPFPEENAGAVDYVSVLSNNRVLITSGLRVALLTF